jgi:hypothetical protein
VKKFLEGEIEGISGWNLGFFGPVFDELPVRTCCPSRVFRPGGRSNDALVYDAILYHANQHHECPARKGGQQPQSKEFPREAGIPLSASVKRALTRLVDLQIVYGLEASCKFLGPFFKQWVLREL